MKDDDIFNTQRSIQNNSWHDNIATVNQPAYTEIRNRGKGVNTFLSGVAVLLSTLALVCSGYTAYQVFTLQQTLNSTRTASNILPIPAVPTAETPTPATIAPATTATASTFTPGQFVQPAFGNKAKVELLSLKRIKDPRTGNRDVVNVRSSGASRRRRWSCW